MTTIDHPLLEANRALESGFLDPEALDRIRDEWQARPKTPAAMREAIFEMLGPGYRGCLPLAIAEILDPETVRMAFPELDDSWLAIGPIDDASVLELADGSWFGARPAPDADRPMAGVFVRPDDAHELEAMLAEGRKPVWAVPATDLLPLGTEREFRAFMDAPEQ